MTYRCECGGTLIYHEQDLENGECHICRTCGKIYPYGVFEGGEAMSENKTGGLK